MTQSQAQRGGRSSPLHQHVARPRVLALSGKPPPHPPVDTGPGQVALDTNVSLTTLLHRHKRLVPDTAFQSSMAPVHRVNFISGLN